MILNMLSRVLGLIREIVIASYFGASGLTDSYFAASRISNFFTTLLGEGSLGTVFIPIYSEIKENEGVESANRFVYNITNLIISICFTISLFIFLFSNFILKKFIGFNDIERLHIANNLLKIMAFYLLFISISGIMSSLLNSYNKFYISTLVGIIFNITIILGVFLLSKRYAIYSLGISFLLSGFFQMLIQLPSFLMIIKKYKLEFNLKNNKYIKEFLYLMLPTLIGIFGYQINELIDTRFAANLKIGTISSINYASRLYLLPIGVFAISLSVVIFPNLSKYGSKKDVINFKILLERGLNILAFLIIPSSFGLYFYSKNIIVLIYKYGKFNENNAIMTSEILQIYALGLLFFSSIHLLTRSHYALKDRKIPVISSFVAIGINIFLDFMLYKKFTHRGLTFATSFSALVNFLILMYYFNKNHIKINIIKYIKFTIIVIINSLISLFIVEKIIPNDLIGKYTVILKLIICLIIYLILFIYKFLNDKNKFFDK